jgi:DNA-binding beta-propeller fold protein YncE
MKSEGRYRVRTGDANMDQRISMSQPQIRKGETEVVKTRLTDCITAEKAGKSTSATRRQSTQKTDGNTLKKPDRRSFLKVSAQASFAASHLATATARAVGMIPTTGTGLHLTAMGLAGLSVTTGGCISQTKTTLPEKTWGRRGFSPGRFLKPRAMAIDPQDNLYIVDTTGRIQVFDFDGNFLRQWKTPETENGRPTGLTFTQGSTENTAIRPPKNQSSSAFTDSARLLVADTHYYRMLSYTPDGIEQENEMIGGTAGFGPGEFAFVTDIACDPQGNRYIGEYNASDRIQKFDRDGNFVCQWGGSGNEPGSFVRPQSLLVRDNVLWVVDSCNHRIQRFDLSISPPELIDIWGGPGEKNGEFFYPYDLDIASDGTVVVIEYKNNRLQRFSSSGQWIASWGGPGFKPGKLNQPWGVVVDSMDRVHILDSNNHRVQRIQMPS